jgi:fumarate reductase flavoprotein subunit
MERGCGIYRQGDEMQATCDKLAELRQRFVNVNIEDKSSVFNTEWLLAIELGYQLEVAQAIACSALHRKESRGAHQRLDGYNQRDDVNYLKHSLATYTGEEVPDISYSAVRITHSPPGVRAYGVAGEQAEADRAAGAARATAAEGSRP